MIPATLTDIADKVRAYAAMKATTFKGKLLITLHFDGSGRLTQMTAGEEIVERYPAPKENGVDKGPQFGLKVSARAGENGIQSNGPTPGRDNHEQET